jgi:cytochrome oxidase Cu insertion factor (SCO1/SenC/PrrC family)
MRDQSRLTVGLQALAVAVVVSASLTAITGGAQPDALESLRRDFGVGELSGEPEPVSLPGLDGERYALERQKGQVVLLYFWATW